MVDGLRCLFHDRIRHGGTEGEALDPQLVQHDFLHEYDGLARLDLVVELVEGDDAALGDARHQVLERREHELVDVEVQVEQADDVVRLGSRKRDGSLSVMALFVLGVLVVEVVIGIN